MRMSVPAIAAEGLTKRFGETTARSTASGF